MNQKKSINRRQFFRNSAIGMIGTGLLSGGKWVKTEEQISSESPRIKEYRTLGRTGFEASDIGVGVTLNGPLLNSLLDAGVNYIDTSETYGKAESVIGEAIQSRNRKSLFITTKVLLRSITKPIPKEDTTKEGILSRVRKSLERLKTDYIDCLMISNAETVDILKSEDFHSAVKQLKEESRIRFVGVSHHGSQFWYKMPDESMGKVLLAAVEDGRFDVVLLAYNFLRQDMSEKVLKVCREKNIGTALMKTNPTRQYYGIKQYIEMQDKAGKKNEIEEKYWNALSKLKEKVDQAEGFLKKYQLSNPDEIRDAATRFCLSNPDVNTVCISFRNFNDVNDYLKLSGSRLTPIEKKMLAVYAKDCGSLYCRHACGLCERQCPHGVPVNTIMRYDHYFAAQGREKYAMEKYARLPTSKADKCQNCIGFCESACPYKVPIHGLLIFAHKNLSLT